MRGCACLKLSGACARGVEGAMARGWSNPQALPRVAVPSGFFSMCCLGVRSLDSSFICPNVTGQRTRHLVAGTLDPLVGLLFSFT